MEKPSRFTQRPPSLEFGDNSATSSVSRRDAHGNFFTKADMETINKDKLIKKIESTNPQRVKRYFKWDVVIYYLFSVQHIIFAAILIFIPLSQFMY